MHLLVVTFLHGSVLIKLNKEILLQTIQTRLWPTTLNNGILTPMMRGIVLARTQETQREVVEGKQYNHKK